MGDKCEECRQDIRFINRLIFSAPCGHLYCDPCLTRLFALQSEIICRACPKDRANPYEKQEFHLLSNAELKLDREKTIRRELLREWSLKREDFNSPIEYEDYLELFENAVSNRVYNKEDDKLRYLIEEQKRRVGIRIANNIDERERDLETWRRILEAEEKARIAAREKALLKELDEQDDRLAFRREYMAEVLGEPIPPRSQKRSERILEMVAASNMNSSQTVVKEPSNVTMTVAPIPAAIAARSVLPTWKPYSGERQDYKYWNESLRKMAAEAAGYHEMVYYSQCYQVVTQKLYEIAYPENTVP